MKHVLYWQIVVVVFFTIKTTEFLTKVLCFFYNKNNTFSYEKCSELLAKVQNVVWNFFHDIFGMRLDLFWTFCQWSLHFFYNTVQQTNKTGLFCMGDLFFLNQDVKSSEALGKYTLLMVFNTKIDWLILPFLGKIK